jgi:hypothetical protein
MSTRIESPNHLCLVIHSPSDAPLVAKTGLTGILARQIKGAEMDVKTPEFPADSVELAVVGENQVCVERMAITKSTLATLLDEGEMAVFKRDIKWGALLEPSLAAQVEIFKNAYEHKECGTSWNDTWSCGCDDECPKCGTSISPETSNPVRILDQDSRGVWDLITMPVLKPEPKPTPDVSDVSEDELIKPRMRM